MNSFLSRQLYETFVYCNAYTTTDVLDYKTALRNFGTYIIIMVLLSAVMFRIYLLICLVRDSCASKGYILWLTFVSRFSYGYINI